jgi:hypothetical protein
MRRGTSTHVVLRQQAAGGEVLHLGRLGPCSPAPSSDGHRRKRWSGRGVARKRRRVRAGVFEVVVSRRACNVVGAAFGRTVAARGSPDPSSTGEGRGSVKRAAKARASSGFTAKRGPSNARELGGSGACPCVGNAVAEVVGRQSRSREARAGASRGSAKSFDARGRGSSARQPGRSESNVRESRAKGRRGPEVGAETSRDRTRSRQRSTRVRGCPPAMEGTSGRGRRLIFTEGRTKRSWQPGTNASCESSAREKRERQGYQRHGFVGECTGETHRAPNPKEPAEANRAS